MFRPKYKFVNNVQQVNVNLNIGRQAIGFTDRALNSDYIGNRFTKIVIYLHTRSTSTLSL